MGNCCCESDDIIDFREQKQRPYKFHLDEEGQKEEDSDPTDILNKSLSDDDV